MRPAVAIARAPHGHDPGEASSAREQPLPARRPVVSPWRAACERDPRCRRCPSPPARRDSRQTAQGRIDRSAPAWIAVRTLATPSPGCCAGAASAWPRRSAAGTARRRLPPGPGGPCPSCRRARSRPPLPPGVARRSATPSPRHGALPWAPEARRERGVIATSARPHRRGWFGELRADCSRVIAGWRGYGSRSTDMRG